MNIRTLIPSSWRCRLRQWQRERLDRKTGLWSQLAVPGSGEGFTQVLQASQDVGSSAYTENKVHNLKLAADAIGKVIIRSGQVFSFWHIIGLPSTRRGYRKGRNLVGGELRAEAGGGLCQLSGIIYFLALKGGLEITERHAHSVDIYLEHERFAPLGSDATVAFAYKDLRFRNKYPFPVKIELSICGNQLNAALCAPQKIRERIIRFETSEQADRRQVKTYADDELVQVSEYRITAAHQLA
jgi:vancomycin resistance protein VanW